MEKPIQLLLQENESLKSYLDKCYSALQVAYAEIKNSDDGGLSPIQNQLENFILLNGFEINKLL